VQRRRRRAQATRAIQTPPRLAQEAESACKFVAGGLTNVSVRRGEPREVSALSFL
jgi:hypothetical protein